MELFSKMLFTALLALDVIFVLSCVLLLAGIAGTRLFRTFNLLQNNLQTLEQCESFRHLLMLPWLVFTAGGIIVQITLVISFMIAVADYGAVAIFLGYENQCKNRGLNDYISGAPQFLVWLSIFGLSSTPLTR